MPINLPPAADAVVIQAPRLPSSPADAAFAVVQISTQDLASTPRLDQVLETSPGASLYRPGSSAGANPTTQGISLRSIAPSAAGRALVTLDGVRRAERQRPADPGRRPGGDRPRGGLQGALRRMGLPVFSKIGL